MSKRILSLVLALVMVLGTFGTMAFAAASDVKGTEYEAAVERLELLNILEGYPDGTFKPENQITRAEFAAVVVRATGMEAVAESAKGLPTGFTDVPASNWASGYVGTAAKLGIVNGVGNGLFAPSAPVKYEEAVTMIMRALGYEEAAKVRGGYPYGYLIVANEVGLLDAVKGTQGLPALRGLVAQLTDNALEIPMMIQVGYGAQTKWVVSGTEDTKVRHLLDDMGFDVFTGRVTGVNEKRSEITLKNDDGTKTVKVAKGFDFYEVEGLNIKAWYAKGEVVLYTVRDEAKFDATTGDKDEIKLVKEDEKYEVAKGAVLVLDGDKVDAEDFDAHYAKVVLNSDDEIVWAEGYTFDSFIVVEEVDETEVVSFNDDDLNLKGYTIVKDGKTIAVEDLEELDVVFYNEGEDFAVVYNNSEVGEIDRVYTNSFRFEGATHDIDADYALYLDDGTMGSLTDAVLADMMDKEEDVEVFFNHAGDVVLVVGERGLAKTDSFYGVVVADTAYWAGRSGNMMSFDLRNSDGELVKYDLSEKFVNDAKNDDKLNVDFEDETNLKGEVVKVTVDEDGDITEVGVLTTEDLAKEFKVTATYAKVGDVDYRLQSSTVVFYDSNKKAIKLGDIDKEFSKIVKGEVVTSNGRVLVVVATETDANADSTEHTGLVTRVRELRDGTFEFTIKVAGKTEVYVTESKTLDIKESTYKNKITTVKIGDKSGKIVSLPVVVLDGVSTVVKSRNTSNKTIDTTTAGVVELTSNAVIYNGKFEAINLRDLKEDDAITVFFDGNSKRFVNYVLVGAVETEPNDTEVTGVVTYIDANDKAVAAQSIDKGDTLDLDVKFNNSGDTNVTIPADKATFQIVNNDDGTVVAVADNKLNAAELVALKGKSVELGTIGETIATEGNYTIIVTVEDANENVYETELALTVLNTDASVTKLEVLDVEATEDSDPVYDVELLFGTDLEDLVASDVVVTTTDENATVGTATIELGSEDPVETATIKVTVTAEDGETEVEYTINVTIAAASDVSTLDSLTVGGIAQAVPTTPFDVAIDLPAGTTETPVVTAEATHAGATVEITPATDVTATDGVANVTTIVVTAEDDSTTTYTVTFTVQ